MSVVAGTQPYPWPYDGRLSGDRLALIVAGGGWRERVVSPATAEEMIERLTAAVLRAGGAVIHLAHGPPPGAGLVGPRLRVPGLDGFYSSALDLVLRSQGRDQLLLTGYGLEAAVHSTLRGATDRGYECLLVTDACACIDPTLAPAALSIICMSGGIFGAVGRAREVVAALESLCWGNFAPHAGEKFPQP